MQKLVIDASFLKSFLFLDESNEQKESSTDLNLYSFISSHLLDFEVLNALQSGVRRRRISDKEQKDMEILYFQLPIEKIELMPSEIYTRSKLASNSQLCIHDSSYLYLAIREKAILSSFDKELLKEAKKLKIPVR